jgi:hypothetical protein
MWRWQSSFLSLRLYGWQHALNRIQSQGGVLRSDDTSTRLNAVTSTVLDSLLRSARQPLDGRLHDLPTG